MKIKFLNNLLLFLIYCALSACANKTKYFKTPITTAILEVLTILMCIIGTLMYALFLQKKYVTTNSAGQEQILTVIIHHAVALLVGTLVFPSLVFGEWSFDLLVWIFDKNILIYIFLSVFAFFLGIFNGILHAVILCVVNSFYWHLSPLYVWYILPMSVGASCRIMYDYWLWKSDT